MWLINLGAAPGREYFFIRGQGPLLRVILVLEVGQAVAIYSTR